MGDVLYADPFPQSVQEADPAAGDGGRMFRAESNDSARDRGASLDNLYDRDFHQAALSNKPKVDFKIMLTPADSDGRAQDRTTIWKTTLDVVDEELPDSSTRCRLSSTSSDIPERPLAVVEEELPQAQQTTRFSGAASDATAENRSSLEMLYGDPFATTSKNRIPASNDKRNSSGCSVQDGD